MEKWLSALLLICFAAAGGAAASAFDLRIAGAAQIVFDHAVEACERWDIPDTPARAWRDHRGAVRLVAGSERSRALVGPSLNAVRRDCATLHEGARSPDPADYDDRAWIASAYTADGRIVEALVHVEHHGHRRPRQCPAGDYLPCWRNAITRLVSRDGGATFETPRDGRLVATSPYRYTGREGRRTGYFTPSNIFRWGEHVYAFLLAEALGAQRRGPCLMRRDADDPLGAWFAHDGDAFAVRFADPYASEIDAPARHVCEPVRGVGATLTSVARRAGDDGFIAVTPATLRDEAGALRSGIWWTTSQDLLDWTRPRLLMPAPLLWRPDCAQDASFAYPAILDDDGPSRMFDVVDDAFWLYLTRFELDADCRATARRDLIRFPVETVLKATR